MEPPIEQNRGTPVSLAFSRRAFLGRAATGAAGLFAAGILAACHGDQAPSVSPSAEQVDWKAWWARQHQTGWMNFANWPLYIDTAKQNRHPSLERFDQQTGIRVKYFHPIQGNASFLEKIQPYLEAGLPPFYDLIVMTNGPQVTKLIDSGWLTPLDQSRLGNFHTYASDLVRDPNWDPGNKYTVAWQSGLTGIGYRQEAVQALGHTPTSIQDLLDPALKGRVGMMSDLLDLGSVGLLAVGVEPADSTHDEWNRAADALRKQRADGVVRGYLDQSYIDALRRGDIWIGQAWSGDIFQEQQAGAALEFVVPDEGAMIWTDNMMIPKNARHPLDAMSLIDFVYRPEIAAMIADWVWYVSPVPAAKEIVAGELSDPTVANSPLVFPTPELLGAGRLKQYRVFENEDEANLWDSLFGSITLGL
ncbi:MAG: polyamine ABC transporter substrate-binding protein [Actinomycetota bacterium]